MSGRGSRKDEWTPDRKAAHKIGIRETHSTPEYRAKLSASLKAKWASGTRKPTKKEAYDKASVTMKKLFAEGKIKKRDPAMVKHWASIGGRTVTERKIESCRRIGKLKLGVPNPPGPSGKGEQNMFSKYWAFKSPTGVTIKGWNLNELVRKNEKMFLPEDLKWKKSSCRAAKGLRGLCEGRPNGPVSWKGWVALPWIVAETVKQAVKDTAARL